MYFSTIHRSSTGYHTASHGHTPSKSGVGCLRRTLARAFEISAIVLTLCAPVSVHAVKVTIRDADARADAALMAGQVRTIQDTSGNVSFEFRGSRNKIVRYSFLRNEFNRFAELVINSDQAAYNSYLNEKLDEAGKQLAELERGEMPAEPSPSAPAVAVTPAPVQLPARPPVVLDDPVVEPSPSVEPARPAIPPPSVAVAPVAPPARPPEPALPAPALPAVPSPSVPVPALGPSLPGERNIANERYTSLMDAISKHNLEVAMRILSDAGPEGVNALKQRLTPKENGDLFRLLTPADAQRFGISTVFSLLDSIALFSNSVTWDISTGKIGIQLHQDIFIQIPPKLIVANNTQAILKRINDQLVFLMSKEGTSQDDSQMRANEITRSVSRYLSAMLALLMPHAKKIVDNCAKLTGSEPVGTITFRRQSVKILFSELKDKTRDQMHAAIKEKCKKEVPNGTLNESTLPAIFAEVDRLARLESEMQRAGNTCE